MCLVQAVVRAVVPRAFFPSAGPCPPGVVLSTRIALLVRCPPPPISLRRPAAGLAPLRAPPRRLNGAAPLHSALRGLCVRDAARALVIADLLCLYATRLLVDDLVQRYAENPAAEADWRGALDVSGCPACDTLWELASVEYAALSLHWRDLSPNRPARHSVSAVPTAAQKSARVAWQKEVCHDAIRPHSPTRGIIADALVAPIVLHVDWRIQFQ